MTQRSPLFIDLFSTPGLLLASPAGAQDNAEEVAALAFGDKESISLATGSRQTVPRAPAVATVITAEDNAAIGATGLDQVLATVVPGIHMSVNADGYSTAIAVRGIYRPLSNPQVLMLQNGEAPIFLPREEIVAQQAKQAKFKSPFPHWESRMLRLDRLALALFSAWSLLAGAAAAQDNEQDMALAFGDRESISLATGSKQTVRRAPAVATVITADDIAAMGATDLDEVLETVPGLHVTRAASLGASLYVMRGVFGQNAPQVLVLQNGIPLTVAISGNKGNLWGGLPLENIARIEVLRGPGSALYGADAFAGVINIITKTAGDISGSEVGLRGGSFNTQNAWLQHGGQLGAMDFAGYLRVGHSDGFKETIDADAQTARDRVFATSASLAPGPVNTGYDAVDASVDLARQAWRWRAAYKLRDEVGTYAGIGSALDPVGRGKSERITSDLGWAAPKFAPDWGLQAGLAYQQFKQTFPVTAQISPPGTRFPTGTFTDGMFGGPEFSERNWRFSASANHTGFARHNLRIGLGHDDLDLYEVREYRNFDYAANGTPIPAGAVILSPTPFNSPHRRRVNYLYVQDEWNFAPDWTLTAGARSDDYSDFGRTTNPRLALVWDASLDLTAKLLYGSAFRAPSFAEQYNTNNPIARGNPAIQPETTRTVEAAAAWQARKDWRLNLNVFRYDMKDIIRTTPNPAPAPGTTYNNAGGQHGEGLELESVWDARHARLSVQYSYQRSIDESTGQDAGFAPRQHAYARLDWRFAAGWQANTQINWVADRHRAAGDRRPAVADYRTVDFTIRTGNGNGGWDFAVSVRNVFDADGREPAAGNIPNDLPLPGRNVWAEVRYGV